MGYLDELRAVARQKGAEALPTKLTEPPFVGFVSASSGHFQRDERRIQKEWRKALAALDACQPRGVPMGRWQTLFDCSVWLFNTFGEQAARDGFSTGDLFEYVRGIRALAAWRSAWATIAGWSWLTDAPGGGRGVWRCNSTAAGETVSPHGGSWRYER
jgi:hypothetical protein